MSIQIKTRVTLRPIMVLGRICQIMAKLKLALPYWWSCHWAGPLGWREQKRPHPGTSYPHLAAAHLPKHQALWTQSTNLSSFQTLPSFSVKKTNHVF